MIYLYKEIYNQKEKQPTAVCNNTDEYHREEFGSYEREKLSDVYMGFSNRLKLT